MIEIELHNHDNHKLGVKIWKDGEWIFSWPIQSIEELIQWRDAMACELEWVNRYLSENNEEKLLINLLP